MTIGAHSLLAGFYSGRPPYAPAFFKGAIEKLGITHDSVLMDLCCGRGELASGFASSCRRIHAIDGSQQMLDHRIARPNVTYSLHDVNNEDVALTERVDHIVIGSAIHWVEPAILAKLIGNNMKPGGKVLVTHTMLRLQDQPWFGALSQLDASFGRGGKGAKSYKDLEGADRLQACGYERKDNVRIVGRLQFDPQYLYRYQLSYLYSEFYEKVSTDLEGYRQRLVEAVTPHLDAKGKLQGTLVNWGVVFGPSRDSQT